MPLFLLFHLGAQRFALPTAPIVEVLPLVSLRALAQAPAGVAGVFDYHGATVPLIDLVALALALGRPARRRMSTRIVLVRYQDGAETPLLGLLAERITDTIRRDESDFTQTGVEVEATPYLGPVTRDAQGLVQRVDLAKLLPEAVRAVLFRQPLEVAA